jgi:hypothetical protein
MVELNSRFILKKVVPRVLKAVVWGSLTYVIVYWLPLKLFPSMIIPVDFASEVVSFAIITVFFAVAGALLSGTIFGYGLGVARAIIIIAYFLSISDIGIISVTLPVAEVPLKFIVDISIILLMIISVNLLDLVSNILQALTFLTEKSAAVDLT